MANNLIQVKRTSVSGRAANSTTLLNPGELALNMSDGILYSTNGSTVFEIGANNTNARVSGTLTVNSTTINSSGIYTTNVTSNLTGNVIATTISGNLTGNVVATTIIASGNVGIGTTSPGVKLDVNGAIRTTSYLSAVNYGTVAQGTSGNGKGRYQAYYGGYTAPWGNHDVVSLSVNYDAYAGAFDSTGKHAAAIQLAGGDAQSFIRFLTGQDATFAERMRIDSTGNVGIGTVTPGAKLEVASPGAGIANLRLPGPNVDNNWAGGIRFYSYDATTVRNEIFNSTGGMQFYTANAERMRIDSTGNIGIGITAPTAKLTVANGTSPTSQHLYGTYTDASNYERINLTANSTGHYVLSEEAGTGTARSLFLGANNATVLTVNSDKSVVVKDKLFGRSSIDHVTYSIFESGVSTVYIANDNSRSGTGYPPATLYIGGLADGRDAFRLNANTIYLGAKTTVFRTQANPNTTNWVSGGSFSVTSNPGSDNFAFGIDDNRTYGWLQYWSSGTATNISINPLGGNVGVGNTNPTHKLRVEGTVSIAGNTTPSANLTFDLGSPTLYWNNVYSNNIVTNSASFSSNVSVGGTLSVTNNVIVNKNLDITSKNVVGLTSLESTVLTTFPVGDYKGGKFTIMAKRGTETHMAEVMVTHNIETAFYNEYSVMYSNTSLFNVSADISGSNVRLLATASTPSDIQFQVMENKFAVDLDTYDRAGTLLLDRSGSVIDERRITREISFGLDFINNSYGLVT